MNRARIADPENRQRVDGRGVFREAIEGPFEDRCGMTRSSGDSMHATAVRGRLYGSRGLVRMVAHGSDRRVRRSSAVAHSADPEN